MISTPSSNTKGTLNQGGFSESLPSEELCYNKKFDMGCEPASKITPATAEIWEGRNGFGTC